MGFFDKIFNSDSKPDPDEITMGIFDNSELWEEELLKDSMSVTVCEIMRDPSKAIDAIHWDGLTPEAREALSQKGFYREGDDSVIVRINP